jgi:hypothetical protein
VATSPVEKIEVNGVIFDSRVQLDGYLLLSAGQHSIPDGTRAHATPPLRLRGF